MPKKREKSAILDAFKFPFRAMRRIWMYYWNFLPILGWIFLGGYTRDLVVSVSKGADKLPAWKLDWKTGFLFALASTSWGIAAYVLGSYDWGIIPAIYFSLVSPVMLARFALSGDFSDAFNFLVATKLVILNFGRYLVLWLRLIAVTLLLLICTIPIVTAIVTIPAAYFSSWYLMSKFIGECE